MINQVRLGIVITHYNRKEFVVPAIKRLMSNLIEKNERISLVVVDNSQDITEEEACGATIIKNENYGGSGGFTRGLLYLKDNGFTHCLFMDDDVSCEIESILKTYDFFQNTEDPSYAIAGSLFDEENPTVLIDKGAEFHKGSWHSRHNGADISKPEIIKKVMEDDRLADYGGWWFFAFNIFYIKHFPFPTFVRGDDVLFSLDNKFKILTPIDIFCWGDSFYLKEGPVQVYLDTRSMILINLVSDRGGLSSLIYRTAVSFFKYFLMFKYESALAQIEAIKDFMKGPSFYEENLNAQNIFKKIGTLTINERMKRLEILSLSCEVESQRVLRKVLFLVTLNGILLPNFLFKEEPLIKLKKDPTKNFWKNFGYKKVQYICEKTKTGITLEMDRMKAASVLIEFLRVYSKLIRSYFPLKDSYRLAHKRFTSEEFWRGVYKLER